MARTKPVLERDEVRGPTWDDVREHLRLASRGTGRIWWVSAMWEDGSPTRKPGIIWTVRASKGKPGNLVASERERWHRWPTSQHKTVPGLLIRLIHELRALWDEEERAKQEGLPF